MEIPIELQIKRICIEDLETVYNFKEILSYCAQCHNYNRNYSCPDLGFDPLEYLHKFRYATLILTIVKTDKIKEHINTFAVKDLEAQVQKLHMPKDVDSSIEDAIAIKSFNSVKNIMTDELLNLEKTFDGSESSPPGSCTRCERCGKIIGEKCSYPDQLRYSLESLGLLVSELYTKYFQIELEWSQGEIPSVYYSCSALFHNNIIQEESIREVLVEKVKSFTL